MSSKKRTPSRTNGFEDVYDGHPVAAMESLEPRILLTTLYSGDVFEFLARTGPDEGEVLRVTVGGSDTIVEILGTGLYDFDNSLRIVDVPGEITSSSIPGRAGMRVHGGIGGFDSIVPVGNGNITIYAPDPDDPTALIAVNHGDPDDNVALNAIATYVTDDEIDRDFAGRTYAFNTFTPADEEANGALPDLDVFNLNEQPLALELLLLDTSEGTGGNAYQVVDNLYPVLSGLAEQVWMGDEEKDTSDTADSQGDAYEVIEHVYAADFNPLDKKLYFVVAGGDDEIPVLFRMDVTAADPATTVEMVEGTFASGLTNEAGVIIHSIAFDLFEMPDPNDPNAPGVVAASLWAAIESDNSELAQIVEFDLANAGNTDTILRSLDVSIPNLPTDEPIEVSPDTLTGIEFVTDDPTIVEPYLFGITADGGESRLLRISTSSGTAHNYGFLSEGFDRDGDDQGQPADDVVPPGSDRDARGENLGGLTYHPYERNPFSGELGVLYATDVETDELVMIYDFADELESRHWGDADQELTFTDAFMVYVVQGDASGHISVAAVADDDFDPPGIRPSEPFSGEVEGWLYFDPARVTTQPEGDTIDVPADTGRALLGTRIYDPQEFPDALNLTMPVHSVPMLSEIGVVPEGWGMATSGLQGLESLLEYASNAGWATRTLGQNLDQVSDMAISRDGQYVVIDTDRVDENGAIFYDDTGDGMRFYDTWDDPTDPTTGNGVMEPGEYLKPTYGDQIAIVNPVTGRAGTPVFVTSAADGSFLSGIQGLDFGDPGRRGSDDLYAVYNLTNTSNVNPTVEFDGAGLGSLLANLNITGLAVSDGNYVYAVDTDSRVDPDTGSNFLRLLRIERAGSTVGEVIDLGRIMDSAGKAVLDIQALEFANGTLYAVGQLAVDGPDQMLFTISTTATDVDGLEDYNPDVEVGLSTGDGLLIDTTGVATNFNIIDVTVDSLGTLFAVADDPVTGFVRLLQISQTSTGAVEVVNDLGRIVDRRGAAIVDVQSIDVGSGNALTIVGKKSADGVSMIFTVPRIARDVSGNTAGSAPDGKFDELVVTGVAYPGEATVIAASTWAGLGVGNVAGQNDFSITTREGATYNFDLDDYANVGELISAVSSRSGGTLFMELIDGKALRLTDNSTFVFLGTNMSITRLNGSTAAIDLGLIADNLNGNFLPADPDNDGVYDTNTQNVPTTFTDTDGDGIDETVDPITLIGAPIAPVADPITAIAFSADGATIYAALDVAGGGGADSQLLVIDATSGVMTNEGDIVSGGNNTEIVGMDINADGDLVALDADRNKVVVINTTNPAASADAAANADYDVNLVGYGSDTSGNFYSILDDGIDNTLYVKNVVDEIEATEIGALGDTDPIAGLAVDSSGQMYGILDIGGGGGNDSRLVTINIATGAITADLGQVLIGGASPAEISAMDFDATNQLVGLDVLNRQIVNIDTATPNNSSTFNAGFVSFRLVGYSYDANRPGFFSIYDDNAADNRLMTTNQATGLTPTLGIIDPATGQFSAIAPLDPDGLLDIAAGVQIQTMAFTNGQRLYILTTEGVLYRVNFAIDPASGQITAVDSLIEIGTVQYGGADLTNVSTMDFDIDGNLFIHDKSSGQLLDVDYTNPAGGIVTAGANTATTTGTLRPTVGAISYDSSARKFTAVDNAPGKFALADSRAGGHAITTENADESAALMDLTGTTSDAPVAQHLDSFLWGGPVWGEVNFSGSMDTFFAGWLITGVPSGQDVFSEIVYPSNFYIGGDIHKIISTGPIGTNELETSLDSNREPDDINYLPGTHIHVRGRLGTVFSTGVAWPGGGVEDGAIIGNITVENADDFPIEDISIISTRQYELEQITSNTGSPEEQMLRAAASFNAGSLITLNGGFITGGDQGWLSNDPEVVNDVLTPRRAEFLGALRNSNAGVNSISLRGTLDAASTYEDDIDFFAVPLMAGQTITTQLINLSEEGYLHVGIFNSDMQLVATDYSNVDPESLFSMPFQYTAETPGIYYFAVAITGDFNFNGDLDDPEDGTDSRLYQTSFYELRISDIGNLSYSGSMIRGDYFSYTSRPAIEVVNGDFGALNAAFWESDIETFYVMGQDSATGISVQNGNLRALIGERLGSGEGLLTTVNWNIPAGNIGLLRASLAEASFNATEVAIGGDFQWIDVVDGLGGPIMANGSIGTINAGSMGSNIIMVNAAGDINRPGSIDLIDVVGDFGVPIAIPVPGETTGGGPQISTGPGGNVRYIRIGGEIYQDIFFGGGGGTPGLGFSSYDPGEAVEIRDDSGTLITVRPVGLELSGEDLPFIDGFQRDAAGAIVIDSETGEPVPRYAGAVTALRTYGIRGSGGVVVIDLMTNSAVNIRTDSHANDGTAEISNLMIEGNGRGLEIGPDGNVQMVPDEIEAAPYDNRPFRDDITINVSGNAKMDFFNVQSYSYLEDPDDLFSPRVFLAPTAHYAVGGSISSFINRTGGELVNMNVGSIGKLIFSGSIGAPKHSTDAEIMPNLNDLWQSSTILSSPWPVYTQRNAVYSDYGFGLIQSDQAIGNILAMNFIGGTNSGSVIGKLVANADKIDDPDVFEGITGVVYSTGDMFYVNIGEGLAASGSGEVAFAGLYAGEVSGGTQMNGLDYGTQDEETLGANIRMVVSDNPYANIYGDIVAYGEIENIRITNGGSIVNADIMVVGDLDGDPNSISLLNSREYVRSFQSGPTWSLRDNLAAREDPASIGKIDISGGGGIIGMYSTGYNIGDITVAKDGFGMFNSRLRTARYGDFGDLEIGGYGIRSVILDGGFNIGQIVATGKGESSSTINYSPTVRLSEQVSQVDGYDNIQYFKDTGQSINRLSDINEYLGTTATIREILDNSGLGQDVTATGIIEGINVFIGGSLGKVDAYQIRSHSIDGFSLFHAAGEIESIITRDTTDGHYSFNGVTIVTGELGKFQPGANVNNLSMTVAGLIKDIRINGSLLGTSSIEATGPNGDIKKITINGDLEGDITSSGRIGTIEVKGDLVGNLTVSAVTPGRYALQKLTVHGSLTIGSLDINGSVGTIKTYGSFGSPGETLLVNGNLDNLYVGTKDTLASVGLDMTVLGDLGRLMVYGQIDGSLLVDGSIKNIDVRSNAGPAISSPINVRGSLTSAKITNGNVLGDITVAGEVKTFMITDGDMDANLIAGDDLNKFAIRNGDLTAGSEVGSSLGNVKNFEIRGGDLDGTVTAANGEIGSISVTGSDMGDQASILARTLKSLKIDGNVENGAAINVVDLLTGVTVGGNVEQGATITAGAASKLAFNGDMLGDLQTGRYARGTALTVKGDLGSNGGSVAIDADTKLSVSGDINTGTTVSVGGELTASITGDINGSLFVDGQIKSLKAAAMNSAMLTAAFSSGALNFTDAITNSLIQIGISRNARGRFDNGVSRMADLKSLSATNIVGSIIAAGGYVDKVAVKENLTDSVIASGLSLGATAMEAVRTGALTVGADDAAILSGADRQLFHGDIKAVTAGTMTDSSVAAGVDPVNGVFGDGDDSVTTPGVVTTGGTSIINSIKANAVTGTNVVTADSGVDKASDNLTPEAPVNDATFIDDITVNNPIVPGDLAATLGDDTGIKEWSATINGVLVTVAISGSGSIDIYDDAATLDRLDTLVLRDTDSKTKITVTTADADTVGLGRIIVNDDATVGTFTFNGDLLGDGTADTDLWLDGEVKDFSFRNMSADNGWSGKIGGDISKLTLEAQGNGRLVIGGQVKTLTVDESHSAASSSLLDQLSTWTYGNEHITEMATNAAGTTFVIDTASDGSGTIYEVDLATGLPNVAITPATLLASLHGGRGVRTASNPANDDMQITMANGNTVTVNLAVAITIQDVIDTIGASLPAIGDVTVEINAEATGLTLTDNTIGGSTFAITAISGSNAASDLGIEQSDSDADGIIEGNLVIGAPIDNRFTGEALELLGMDFDEATGELIAITELLNYNPTQFIGNLSNRPLSLKGLAISSDGRIIAAESAEFALVDGDLGADYDIRALTVDTNDVMYAIHLNGATNNFELYRVDRDAATGEITDFVQLGEITDMTGNVIRDIEAMETDPATGELKIVGIRPAVGAGDVQELFTLDPTAVDSDGDTNVDEVVATQIAGIAEYMAITAATPLADFNYAAGVDSDGSGLPDILFRLSDGTTTALNLDALPADPTVGDLINAINMLVSVGAMINAAGTGLEVFDNTDPTTGTTTFEIVSLGGTSSAEDLGIAQTDTDGDYHIVGNPINPVEITDTIHGLAVDANGNYFAARDYTGVIPTVSTLIQIDTGNVGQTPQGRNVTIISNLGEIKSGLDNTLIRGIDFASDGQLIGQDFSGGAGKTRRVIIDSVIPTSSAFMTPEGSDSDDSRGLASDAVGRFYVIDSGSSPDTLLTSNTLRDRLIEINPDTGGIVDLGYMRDFYGNYLVANTMQLAFTTGGINGQDKLLILINDRDGNGPAPLSDGVAMAAVDWTDEGDNGYLLFTDPTDPDRDALSVNGLGGELLDFTGMAVDSSGTVYAIRRNATDTADELVTLTAVVAGSGLSQLTPLSSIGNGQGVGIVEDGLADIRIQLRDGSFFDVVLDGAKNIQDVIDLVNAAAAVAGAPLDLMQFGGANNLIMVDAATIGVGLTNATLLTDLDNRSDVRRIDGMDDFTITDPSGAVYNVALDAGDTTIGDVLTKIAIATGGQVLPSLYDANGDGDDDSLQLQYTGLSYFGTPITVNAVNGSFAAMDLGLANPATGIGTNGDPLATTFVGNNIQPKLGMFQLNGSTAATDLGFPDDNVATAGSNFEQVDGNTLTVGAAINENVIGEIAVDGNATTLTGIGFDHLGNLVAFNNGDTTEIIGLTTDNFADASMFEYLTSQDLLGATHDGIDAFAISSLAGDNLSYAYNTSKSGSANGELFVSPGMAPTLGLVDLSGGDKTGGMFQLLPLAIDDQGTTLSQTVSGLAVDNDGGGNVFVVTDGGMLLEYDAATGAIIGTDPVAETLVDPNSGATLNVKSIDFNDAGSLIAIDSRFNTLYHLVTVDGMPDGAVRGDAEALLLAGQLNVNDLTTLTFDPVAGELYSFRDSDNAFVQLLASTQGDADALTGGIDANSVNTLNIGSDGSLGYNGRISTSSNTIKTVKVTGDFGGMLISSGEIGNFTMNDGDFSGSLMAGDDIKSVKITDGDITDTGIISATGELKTLTQKGGDFAGQITAASAGSFKFSGEGTATADIIITGTAKTISFDGDYAGRISVGDLSTLTIGDDLGATADISIANDAGTINIKDDAFAGSLITVGKSVKNLTIADDFAGTVAIGDGLNSAKIGSMTSSILMVGGDTRTINVSGSMDNALISIGTWLGADGIYNTEDDVIVGGTVRTVSIRGDFIDSAVVAGVLPSLTKGDGVPADKRAYVGTVNGNVLDSQGRIVGPNIVEDSAEAGGGVVSVIESISIRGDVINTSTSTGRQSIIAAADGIGKVTGPEIGRITTRVYSDPLGAPYMVSSFQLNASAFHGDEFRVVFSEEVNTDSFVLSIDGDDDGQISSAADVFGSILITDANGDIIDDGITIGYMTQVADSGITQGVLRLLFNDGFAGLASPLTVTLSDDINNIMIYDRSGSRSVLRDFNQDGEINGQPAGIETPFGGEVVPADPSEDPFKTIYSGSGSVVFVPSDMPNDFDLSLASNIPLAVDDGGVSILELMNSDYDVDVYRLEGLLAGQFLTAEFSGLPLVHLAIFEHDTQGTVETADDFFETVARFESYFYDYNSTVFQAVELANDGDYFVVVAGMSGTGLYQMDITLSSTDEIMATQVGGTLVGDGTINLGGGEIDTIGYINNVDNTTKQLVYLNFDGGQPTDYEPQENVIFEAFDPTELDASFDGYLDTLINGDGGVTGIIDNVLAVYNDLPATALDAAGLPADFELAHSVDLSDPAGLAQYNAATDGIWFTTVNPADYGFDRDVDFNTGFIGQANDAPLGGGLYGIASNIDMMNMHKSDDFMVFAQNHSTSAIVVDPADPTDALNQYSSALAFTIAHELGHTLGLNHQPTDYTNFYLVADDPDNDPGTLDDSNTGIGLMAYPTDVATFDALAQLGTSELAATEFTRWGYADVDGSIDTLTLLLRWLA